MPWNKKVLDLMKQRGINQKQLSKLSGINESSISRYLHSDQRPRMDVVVNISKALGVDVEYLLEADETIEKRENSYIECSSMLARNAKNLTNEEKMKLIKLLLGD